MMLTSEKHLKALTNVLIQSFVKNKEVVTLAKEDVLELEGTVLEALPNAMFQV